MTTDTGQTPHLLRYHSLGVLCWLYPVGYPRIWVTYVQDLASSVLMSLVLTSSGSLPGINHPLNHGAGPTRCGVHGGRGDASGGRDGACPHAR